MSSTSSRIAVSLGERGARLLVLSGRKIVEFRETASDADALLKDAAVRHGAAAALALVSPSGTAARIEAVNAPADAAAALALLGSAGVAAACSAKDGRPGFSTPVLLAGAGVSAVEDVRGRLAAAGLAAARTAFALPAQIGTVAVSAKDVIAVWILAEDRSFVARIGPDGVRSLAEVPAGYQEIFQAVQAALGLKFKAAAAKLFFNDQYDFSAASPAIAAALVPALKAALGDDAPGAFHVEGLPSGQRWFAEALAASLGIPVWSPSVETVCQSLGLEKPDVVLPPSALPLLLAVEGGGAWAPPLFDSASPVPAATPAAPPPQAATPAPVSAPASKPTPKIGLPPKSAAPAAVPVQTSAPAQSKSAAPVAATAAKSPPVPVPAAAAAQAPAPVTAPVPAPTSPSPSASVAKHSEVPESPSVSRKKNPVPLIAAAAVALLAAGGGAWFFMGSGKSANPAEAAPSASAPAAPKPAPVSPAVLAALQAEVERDPMSFRNERYSFSVSPKGVLTDIKLAGAQAALIPNLGFVRLYGVLTDAAGNKTGYRAGGWQDPACTASTRKMVRGDSVVFDISIRHPRFQVLETITCLPGSIKVNARFLPVNLSDERTKLDAIYGIHLNAALLAPGGKPPEESAGRLSYATLGNTTVTIAYQSSYKGPGEKPVIGDPALASFVLATAADQDIRTLDYELALP